MLDAQQMWNTTHRFDYKVDEARSMKLRNLQILIEKPIHTLPFRGALIDRLISELENEVTNINTGVYGSDISLDQSFLTRAISIFKPAHSAHAVSFDAYSGFWASEDTKLSADEYLSIQPPNTYRLFVFSSALVMGKHRGILAKHYEKYGSRAGRVLFTDSETWKNYVTNDLKPATTSFESDFGILRYNAFLPGASFGQALLRRGNISFQAVDVDAEEGWRRKFMTELEAPAQPGGPIKLGAGFAHLWREEFKTDDDLWFAEISRTFKRDRIRGAVVSAIAQSKGVHAIERRGVLHIVMFSNERTIESSLAGIREIIPGLLNMRSADGRQLIDSVWYGNSSQVPATVDPAHGASLRIHSDQIEWPVCMIMRFNSEEDLAEYYRSKKHSNARKRLYKGFQDIELCQLVDTIEDLNEGPERKALGAAIEVLAAKYMKRIDFSSRLPNPYLELIDLSNNS